MTARANCLAVCGITVFKTAPFLTCKCKSSGLVMVNVFIISAKFGKISGYFIIKCLEKLTSDFTIVDCKIVEGGKGTIFSKIQNEKLCPAFRQNKDLVWAQVRKANQ